MVKIIGPRPRPGSRGFTLIEVMVAIVIGMIGLLGTVAIQQTMLRATQNANDAMIASRLATQQMEMFAVVITDSSVTPTVDQMAALAAATGGAGVWSAPAYLDANGRTNATATPQYRFTRSWIVTNRGVNLPYNISVKVEYALETGNAKQVRIDEERYKTW
jgi:prepilin-type N-terminal cleavage/methylation domain-containing protein